MEVAILVFGVIAAVAAAAGVALQLWQQRTRLELRFRDGLATASDMLSFPARAENPGQSPIYDVELFAGPPGITLDQQHRLDVVNIQPRTFHDFYVDVGRPRQAEIEQGQTEATLSVPLIIVARYGRRAIVVEMPAGPFQAARAKTKRHRRRWP